MISRDVTFIENEFPMKLLSHQKLSTDTTIDPSNPLIEVELSADSSSVTDDTTQVDGNIKLMLISVRKCSNINLQDIDRGD